MKRAYRILAIVIASLLVVLVVLSLIAGNLVEAEARAYLQKNPPKGVKVDFEDIGVRLWSRAIKVKGISILSTTDSASLYKKGLEPESIQIESIKISGVSIIKALKGEHFKVNRIEVIHPSTRLMTEGSVFNARESIEKTNEARADTTHKDLFKTIEVGTILMKDGELAIIDSVSGSKLLSTLKTSFELKNVYVDSSFKNIRAAEMDVDIMDAELTLPGDLYQLKFGGLHLAKHDSLITFDSLLLVPLYPKYKFADAAGKQTDRFSLQLKSLMLKGINFDSLLMAQKPIVRLAEVDGMHASIFRDKNKPFDFSNYPKLPNEGLRTMDLPIIIDQVKILDGYVEYQEHGEGAEEPGMVFFEAINGSITNITSDSASIIKEPYMEVNASMMLYGQGQMEANIRMLLNDPQDNFTFMASLGKMEARETNRMIQPGNMVDIKAGTIDKLTLTGTANRYIGGGTMTMLYQDLVIEVLKEDKKGEVKKRWLVSSLANEIVKSSNPVRNQPARVVPMYFERDMNKGIFNFLWKTCFSGIKETLKPTRESKKE